MLDGGPAVLASEPRGLHATKRQLDRCEVVVNDPAGAGLQARDDAVSPRHILGKHGGGESELGRIGSGDDLILALELEHGHHRSEDFIAGKAHLILTPVKHRRRDEKALRKITTRDALAADDESRALGTASSDASQNLLHVLARDERANLGRRIQW